MEINLAVQILCISMLDPFFCLNLYGETLWYANTALRNSLKNASIHQTSQSFVLSLKSGELILIHILI